MKTRVIFESRPSAQIKALVKAQSRGDAVLLDGGLGQADLSLLRGRARVLTLAGGEEVKRWSELARILAFLADQQIERGATLYVVGGGALCDVGALAASLYRRGIGLVLVPTTLLAAADASLGGKCAVDLLQEGRLFKNVVGAFYPARELWISPAWWSSLNPRERRSGVAEVIKILWLHGKSFDADGLRPWLAGQKQKAPALEKMLKQAIVLKAAIVKKDPMDQSGIREQLNFGHSIGHALESLGRGDLSHGEAVAWGMWAECEVVKSPFAKKIRQLLENLNYPRPMIAASPEEWLRFLKQDKKIKAKKLPLTVLQGPGKRKVFWLSPELVAKKASQLFIELAR